MIFFNVVFSMFVCYSAAFCQLCFYNKDWIGLDWMSVFNQMTATFLLTVVKLFRLLVSTACKLLILAPLSTQQLKALLISFFAMPSLV